MSLDSIQDLISQLHFLRPLWFLALLPALLLALIFTLRQGKDSAWERSIDVDLLPHLIESQHSKPASNPIYLIALGWLLAIIALAGPVWEKTPQPVHEREDALIILFDLSRSMYATDIKPDRLTAARRKLLDLLKLRNEGVTGLVVYSGDAHLVSPLTDDANTIAEMIPAVAPEFMPAPGSQLAPALKLAHSLFKDAGVSSGRIVIVTDEIRDIAESQNIARQHRYTFPISVLGLGTAEGAPIPGTKLTRDGGYLKDFTGTIIVPGVDFEALKDFANLAGGRFARMSLVDTDLEYLLADEPLLDQQQFREMERDFDIWMEKGPWLLLLLLPLAALSFRRGWLWSVLLICCLPTDRAYASLWDDLWQTRDQQAIAAMNQGNAEQAASLFEDPQWKASAQYKAQNFNGAAEQFQTDPSQQGRYNLGNALAKQGKYEEAIQAYTAALELAPDHEDAQFNKQLVEELLESQQEQNQEQGGEDENQPSDESEEGQQNDNQENSEEDSQQQSEDQQEQDAAEEQSSEEQSSEEQQQADQDQQDQEEQDATDEQMSQENQQPLDEEQQQALQQWLKQVPDDPGGLLRRKFKMQYDERIKQGEVRRDETSNW
jgi:Ca-activated chloride channel family protein